MPRITFTDDVSTYISQSPECQSSAPFAMPRPMVRVLFLFTFSPFHLSTDIGDYSNLKWPELTLCAHRHPLIALPMFHPYVQQSVRLPSY